jgi:ribosomal protein S18 acetylase RimI-like enzyme
LGRAVLARGLKELQKAGYDHAGLSVDSENNAAINLYRGLEMNVTRERLFFHKSLDNRNTQPKKF